jgi:hypothetical protein
MVAKYVDRLLAQRAGSFFVKHGHTKPISYCDAEDSGAQQGVLSVLIRGDSGNKAARVWLGCSPQPLGFSRVSPVYEESMHRSIELERGLLLRLVLRREVRRRSPVLFAGAP